MATTHGITRQFGSTTYQVSGFRSYEAAVLNVYRKAHEAGKWTPPKLRKKWWQIWLPKDYDKDEKIYLASLEKQ